MYKSFIAALLAGLTQWAAAAPAIDHMEPPSWWVGMENRSVQLMVHGPGIAARAPALAYPGVRIDSVTRVANPNYLFINLTIGADARPGTLDIMFGSSAAAVKYAFPLLARVPGSAQRKGFDSSDAIYQVMPDRFVNGDTSNDGIRSMADQPDRSKGGGRHGGDIAGLVKSLDYIAQLGFTQLWPTPLVENDMPADSYHGYAATDHYKIDARYGSNADYRRLSGEARKRGIGIIQDVVLSHIGSGHWWMKDMPTPDWTNHGGKYVPTKHHRVAVQDPYAAQHDRANFTTGWFTSDMPDLNQTNPLVANYLIQNNIWWIEYAGLSGLRIDTYGYSDTAFLAGYTRRLMAEYPNLNMVGEEWSKLVPVVAHWQRGKAKYNGYVSSLPSLMDFPMAYAIRDTLAAKEMGEGFNDIYETLSLDYLYGEPSNLVLFEGNHDVPRMFSVVNEDLDLYKMALVYLMTMPRIPQFYYGTEVLMTSTVKGRDDASYRADFPGGWQGDKVDAFSGAGLNARQREAQAFVRKLANWRRGQPAIHQGRMTHFGAEDGTYVYFRHDASKVFMVAFNKNTTEAVLPTARFQEVLKGAKAGVDVLTGKRHALDTTLTLPARSTVILEL